MSETVQEQRRRRRHRMEKKKNGPYRIKARICHEDCIVETEDYGSFKEMYAKYGQDGVIYYCADVVNYQGVFNYRLDSDIDKEHTKLSLRAYGKHRSWIQPGLKMHGKKVILVKNAEYRTNRETGGTFRIGVYGLGHQTRPGQVDFHSLFEVPGSDLDFIQERNGKFIIVEFKKKGEEKLGVDDGQRILLDALARQPNFTVVIYTHDENYEGTGQVLSGVSMPITSKAKLQLYIKLWRQRADTAGAR